MNFFDRHGALAIMFAIFVQTAGAIWWASAVNSQIGYLREDAAARDAVIAEMIKNVQHNSERLTKIQTVQETVVKVLDRLTEDKASQPR